MSYNYHIYCLSSDGLKTEYSGMLQKGTYYLRVRYKEFTYSGEIELEIESSTGMVQTPVNYLDDINVLNHLHNSHNELIYNDNFDRLVEIKLNVTSNNEVYLPEGTIIITDVNGNVIPKFYTDIADLAYSKEGQNIGEE